MRFNLKILTEFYEGIEEDIYEGVPTIELTVNLNKMQVIDSNALQESNSSNENENQNNNSNDNSNSNSNNNNNNNNSGNNNNSNNNEDDRGSTTNRGDANREDNTEADGKLPYTGTHIGLVAIAIVSIMLIVGIVNKRKYKDIK